MNANVNNIMKQILMLDQEQQKMVIDKITNFFADNQNETKQPVKNHKQPVYNKEYFTKKLRNDAHFMSVIKQIKVTEASKTVSI